MNIKKRVIARKVIVYILLCSTAITLIVASFQLYMDYRMGRNYILDTLQQIENSYLNAINRNVWTSNEEQLETQLEGILQLPDIQYARIEYEGNVFETGQKKEENTLSRRFPLSYTFDNTEHELGTLYVNATLDNLYQRIINKALYILLFHGAEIFIVTVFIFIIFHYMVTRHLYKIARFARDMDINKLSVPIILDRPSIEKKQDDELDHLVYAFNEMAGKLARSYASLNEEIKERKQAEQSLMNEKEMLQKLLDTAAVIVVMIDADQKITLINKKGCDILGVIYEDVIGKNWFDNFIPEYASDEVKIVFNKLMAGETEPIDYYENVVLTQNGEERLIAWYNTIFRDENGKITNTLGTGVDITESRKAEDLLKETKTLLQAAMDSSQAAIAIAEAPSGKLRYVNKAGLFIPGGTHEEYIEDVDINKYVSNWQILHFDGTEYKTEEVPLARAIMYGETCSDEFILKRYDGENRIVWANAAPILDAEGKVKFGIVVFLDITERKEMEEKLKSSLAEKVVLLQEIHHRVKNNFTIIMSLLKLQSRNIKDEKVKAILRDSENRIKSMSLVHEMLYRTENLANIDFGEYVKTLTETMLRTYNESPARIKIKVDMKDIQLNKDTSITLGLVINELLSNAMNHAFPGDRAGEISIAMKTAEMNNEYEVIIKDNGAGLPEGFDIMNTDTLGLNMVTNMVKSQLRGSIDIKVGGGTEYKIRFKELKSQDRIGGVT